MSPVANLYTYYARKNAKSKINVHAWHNIVYAHGLTKAIATDHIEHAFVAL